jgi:catechol 2,3-dioxygenase-like lactoylglutathione lyase family enzyme
MGPRFLATAAMWRRRTAGAWLCAALLGLAALPALGQVRVVQGFALTVSDVDRSEVFYEKALGFQKVAERHVADPSYDALTGVFGARVRSVTLRLGEEAIELDQFVAPGGEPIPIDSRSNDLWFQHLAIVVSDMEKAYRHLSEAPFQAISSEPQTIPATNAAAAGVQAFKFKDPDGHPLELLYFPPGKGRPKWHVSGDKVFLGVDHSAITVSDTERSLGFYRDLLGMRVAGGSLNTGPTQERLDGAFGAVVRVTGLRPQSPEGPGIEFLQYLTPAGGRAATVDVRASDTVHVHSVLEVDDLDALVPRLEQAKVVFVSPRVVERSGMPFRKGLMVKDPDGHAVMLVRR